MTKEELTYYHSYEEYKLHDPLGIIFLKNISEIFPIDQKGLSFAFKIKAGVWQKKDELKGTREFIFIADTDEERDNWITLIELMKALSVHRNFTSQFSKVNFPLKSEEEVKDIFFMKFSLMDVQKDINIAMEKRNINIAKTGSFKGGNVLVWTEVI